MKTSKPNAIRRQAAEWLAHRQARGFTPAEDQAFASWYASDPRHSEMFHQLETAWTAFDKLSAYRQLAPASANADFFAPSSPIRFLRPALMAAAAAIVFASVLWFKPWRPGEAARIQAGEQIDHGFLRLTDGSEVELNPGSEVVENFLPGERRVHLVRGEAQFFVAKNPARPFIVEAGGVAVRAVGTAFDVRLGAAAVEVLVTEGTVQVSGPVLAPGTANHMPAALAVLVAGQRTVVSTVLGAEAARPAVETLADPDIDRALAWQTSRLVFDATALSEVVTRFNLYSARRGGVPHLTLGDADVGKVRISGRIRRENVESFVDALKTGFGVSAERRSGSEIILRSSPPDSR